MFRHLSSAFTALNYQIAGMNPLGYVLHSVLWYLVIIVLVGLLARRIVPGSGGAHHPVSFITVIIFALAFRNAFFIYYGGARWMLITIAFGLAGLLAHIKWREQDWKPGRYLSLTAFFLAMPESWWPLSYLEKNNRYHRTAENKLELEIIEGSLLDHPYIQDVRNLDVPFKKGEILRFSGFQVTILEVNKDGPTRMEFTFERSLDDEIYRFYKLQEGRLHIVTPPVVGQSLSL